MLVSRRSDEFPENFSVGVIWVPSNEGLLLVPSFFWHLIDRSSLKKIEQIEVMPITLSLPSSSACV
jgi:hypothetical protein